MSHLVPTAPMFEESPIQGADVRVNVYSRWGNVLAIDIAIADDGLIPVESDAGDRRTNDVIWGLEMLSERGPDAQVDILPGIHPFHRIPR